MPLKILDSGWCFSLLGQIWKWLSPEYAVFLWGFALWQKNMQQVLGISLNTLHFAAQFWVPVCCPQHLGVRIKSQGTRGIWFKLLSLLALAASSWCVLLVHGNGVIWNPADESLFVIFLPLSHKWFELMWYQNSGVRWEEICSGKKVSSVSSQCWCRTYCFFALPCCLACC